MQQRPSGSLKFLDAMRLFAIALFGALGAISRYGASVFIARFLPATSPERAAFPWPTLIINVIGSFLLGVIVTLVAQRVLDEEWRYALGVGFLGAFTTFSTFSVETDEMIQCGLWTTAAFYIGCSVVLGVLAVVAGRALALRMIS